ncbi:right-handed parallel beta-helix repeat-containing protein, partial [Patescibacteria group bacterium]|nr:right-handed parallel beta-helix repeat-containing protein [Patescibacteria group bacterium]
MKKGLISIFLITGTLISIWFLFGVKKVQADECGDGVEYCNCGDTVVADYTLDDNLYCSDEFVLMVGADDITINGGGYTISGDAEVGIYNEGYSNVTITNFTITNFDVGILFSSSDSNNLTNNIISSNSYGIYLDSSTSNTLTSNIMSGNGRNLYVTGSYDNTIGISNLVESKPVYYLYEASDETYDGDDGDIGMFWCISCTNVTVRDASLSTNNYAGVYFYNTASSTIQNITVSSNFYGILIASSTLSYLTSNTASSNSYGIYLDSSTSNTLTSNIMSGNGRNLYVTGSYDNTIGISNLVE